MIKLWNVLLISTCSLLHAEKVAVNNPIDKAQVGTINDLTIPKLSKVEKRVKAKISDCQSRCGSAIAIGQDDVGPDGYVISQSGLYCLKEDIIFDPSADNVAAITINADFVILDFSEHVLTQSATSFIAFDNTSGVLVNPGSNYISVQNGTIELFSNMGVFVKGSNAAPTDHKGILIENMRVLNCGKSATIATDRILNPVRSAIGIDSSQDVVVTRCFTSATLGVYADGIDTQFSEHIIFKKSSSVDHAGQSSGFGVSSVQGRDILIHDCDVQRIAGATSIGITTNDSTNVIVNNCVANDGFGAFNVFGIGIFATTNVIISNSVANSNAANNMITDATVRGIYTSLVTNSIIKKCETFANNATAQAGTSSVSGIFLEESVNCRITNCRSVDNRTQGAVAIAYGIQSDTVDNCVIEESIVEGNSAIGSLSFGAGIGLTVVKGALVNNCHSIGNSFFTQQNSTSIASGILIDGCADLVVQNSSALNNQSPNNVQSSISGITVVDLTGVVQDIAIKNCTASGQSAVNSLTRVTGIRIQTSASSDSKVVVQGCVVENNSNTAIVNQGVGIDVRGVTGCTLFRNIAKGNGLGILLEPQGGTNTARAIVQENEASANSSIGFEDSNGIKNNAYLNNVAYNPAGTNYLALPANTPIRIWTIGSVPSAPVARDIDNLDLR